jgi:tripartite-type tricarboxylate transporter receptor subunit TctC
MVKSFAQVHHQSGKLNKSRTSSCVGVPQETFDMRRQWLGLIFSWMAFASLGVQAQDFPNKTIRIINPFPGGPTDSFARLVASKLQTGLKQSVIVDAKAGAGGAIGVTAAAKSAPDGYTLLITSASTQIVQPVVKKSMPYDAEKDFVPIMATGASASVIVVHPSLPVKNLREFIDYARANPEAVSYGSSGNGTALHLAGEVFASIAGVKLQHIPYKTAAQSMTDLWGGQVKAMFDSPNNSSPQIKNGKVKGLAIMGSDRISVLPDLPTTTELGMPKMRFTNWLGVYAPAGTPADIVDRLIKILRAAINDADMKEYFERSGMPLSPLFGQDMAQASRIQRSELAEVIKSAGIALLD